VQDTYQITSIDDSLNVSKGVDNGYMPHNVRSATPTRVTQIRLLVPTIC